MSETASFWDERYRREEPYGREPTALLVENRHLLPPDGKALDVAMGTGRNALYLASLGYEVTGIDVSKVAVEHCRQEAEKRELQVEAILADLESYELVTEAYDLVVNFLYLDRQMSPKLVRALRPGGVLVFETFTTEQLAFAWGPRAPQFLLRPGELRGMFPELEVLLYREGVVEGERGPKAIASLIGRRLT